MTAGGLLVSSMCRSFTHAKNTHAYQLFIYDSCKEEYTTLYCKQFVSVLHITMLYVQIIMLIQLKMK